MSLSFPDRPRIRRSTGETDKTAAQRVHDAAKAGAWIDTSTGGMWSDAVTAWKREARRSDSELLSLAKFHRHFKDRPIKSVTGGDIANALSFCGTAGTYNRYRAMLVAVLNLAKKNNLITEVPRVPVRKDKKPKARKWLSYDEWDRLYAALPQHLKGPAMVAVQTGLRQANVFGLRWKNVDLGRRHVVVAAEDAKAGAGIPVPLNDAALEAIKAEAGKHHEFVFAYRGRPMAKPKEGFAQAKRDSGLPSFTWHGLRHTWATWHIQNGTPVDVLQKLGGWADLRMVMTYAHHSAGYLAQFADNNRKKP